MDLFEVFLELIELGAEFLAFSFDLRKTLVTLRHSVNVELSLSLCVLSFRG